VKTIELTASVKMVMYLGILVGNLLCWGIVSAFGITLSAIMPTLLISNLFALGLLQYIFWKVEKNRESQPK
jgi:hypothetical protein